MVLQIKDSKSYIDFTRTKNDILDQWCFKN